METQNHSFTLRVVKKDKKPSWHKLKTVNEIYQLACSLSEKDCSKMLDDFKEAIELAVSMRKACGDVEENNELKLECFRWSK